MKKKEMQQMTNCCVNGRMILKTLKKNIESKKMKVCIQVQHHLLIALYYDIITNIQFIVNVKIKRLFIFFNTFTLQINFVL